MKVGMMPLAVHVPEIAPIRKSISMAEVTSETFFSISRVKASQGVLKIHIDSQMHTPDARSRATWLAPRMESLPNMVMFMASVIMRMSIGASDTDVRIIVFFLGLIG